MTSGTLYQAIVIQGPGRAALRELPLPRPGPQDVLLKVAYVGICATDIEVLRGELGYYKAGVGKYPIIPGHEFSAVVADGQGIDRLTEGMPVVVECIQACQQCQDCRKGNWIGCKDRKEVGVLSRDGACAEYIVVPRQFVHMLPEGTDLQEAALCEPAAVVLKGIRRLERILGPGPEKRCAVVGCGPIGHLCARSLALRGYKVAAYDRNPARLAFLQDLRGKTFTQLKELDEFDAIIEATGSPQALHLILEESRPGCVLLLLGFPYARQPFNFETLVGYDKTVIGSVGSTAADFEEAIRLLPNLDLTPFLQQSVPLQQYQKAWDLFQTGDFLKVMIAVDPSLNQRKTSRTPA